MELKELEPLEKALFYSTRRKQPKEGNELKEESLQEKMIAVICDDCGEPTGAFISEKEQQQDMYDDAEYMCDNCAEGLTFDD